MIDWVVSGYQKDNNEDGFQMDSTWISDPWKITMIDWIVFGYLTDNKEDRL